jgi:hypothetical protein
MTGQWGHIQYILMIANPITFYSVVLYVFSLPNCSKGILKKKAFIDLIFGVVLHSRECEHSGK